MPTYYQGLLSESSGSIRRKCFVSYYGGDTHEVEEFIRRFESVFIPKVVGVSDNDFIDSDSSDYVMGRIRKDFLGDSSVTICLLGMCTHSRRYVDWELKASLRQGETYNPNGLLGIQLRSASGGCQLPPRFADNWNRNDTDYGLYRAYPQTTAELRGWIDEAYTRRTTRAHLILNSQERLLYNRKCEFHGVTH